MNDKNVKEAIKQYVEIQVENNLSAPEDNHDLSALDAKVYATINAEQRRSQPIAWSFKKVSALATSFILVISLSIMAIFMLDKEPIHTTNDVTYSIIISYENEKYGYYSNRVVIDKYGLADISDLKETPDLFNGSLADTDIIEVDSIIDKDSIIGAKIYPYSDAIIILQSEDQFYYFERIATE